MVEYWLDNFVNESQTLEVHSGGSAGLMTMRAANGFCNQRSQERGRAPFMPSVFVHVNIINVCLARYLN